MGKLQRTKNHRVVFRSELKYSSDGTFREPELQITRPT